MFDKNGCGSPYIYCWACSGKNDDDVRVMTNGDKRKLAGCMIPQSKSKSRDNVNYKCMDCDYTTNYYKDYVRAWKI